MQRYQLAGKDGFSLRTGDTPGKTAVAQGNERRRLYTTRSLRCGAADGSGLRVSG